MVTRTLALPSERWQSRDTEMLLFLWPGEQQWNLVSMGAKTSTEGMDLGAGSTPQIELCGFLILLICKSSHLSSSCEPDGWLINCFPPEPPLHSSYPSCHRLSV